MLGLFVHMAGGRLLALAASVLLCLVPLAAWAEDSHGPAAQPDEDVTRAVRNATAAGFAEYRAGNLEAARHHFLQAWELRPYKGIALSLAEIEMKLGLYLEAARHWQWFLEHIDDEGQRATAQQQLDQCLQHLGRLRLEINVPGATVVTSGTELDHASNLQEVLVEPGQVLLQVEHATHWPYQRLLSVEPGELLELRVHLAPRPAPQAVDNWQPETDASPPPASVEAQTTHDLLAPRDRPSSTARTVVLASGMTLTAASLVTSFGMRLKSANYHHEVDVAQRLQTGEQQRNIDQADRYRTLSNVSLATGGTFALATVVTWLLWPNGSSSPAPPGQETLRLGPHDAARGQGLELSGTF